MSTTATLIAVDIGNSRIKLARFDRVASAASLPEPAETLALELGDDDNEFDAAALAAWCDEQVAQPAEWLVASVNRPAAGNFVETVKRQMDQSGLAWSLRQLTNRDVPIAVDVDEPEQVGIDRLLAALAANQVRQPERAAVVVDMGSANTVDLVTAGGTYAGGAILAGVAMSARALADQTDLLPRVQTYGWSEPPAALGRTTVGAIEAGIYWGAVGAVAAVVDEIAAGLAEPPEVLVTGGSVPQLVELLEERCKLAVRHVPHLVIAGVALVDAAGARQTA